MRHSFKYWLALTGVVSLFLFFCPTFASAQKQFEYLSKVKKLSSPTLKFELPKFPRYVPIVSHPPLSPTNSGNLLELPARQVVNLDPQSVNLLSHPNINFTHDRLEFDPNFHNLRPQSSPNEPTSATQKEKNNQQSYDATFTTILQNKDSEAKSKASGLLSPEDDKRWVELGKEIEELGIRLGLEKMENLLFQKSIQIERVRKQLNWEDAIDMELERPEYRIPVHLDYNIEHDKNTSLIYVYYEYKPIAA